MSCKSTSTNRSNNYNNNNVHLSELNTSERERINPSIISNQRIKSNRNNNQNRSSSKKRRMVLDCNPKSN